MRTQRTRIIPLVIAMVGLVLAGVGCSASRPLRVADLRCEYRVDPSGIDTVKPRLSWRVEGDLSQRGQRQLAYRVLVASKRELLNGDKADLWDSGDVVSDRTTHIEYGGMPPASGSECFWKVRAWNVDDVSAGWSHTGKWTTGLLQQQDWHAKWIGLDMGEPSESQRYADLRIAQWIWFPGGQPEQIAPAGVRWFRKGVMIPEGRKIRSAVCLMTADNSFTLFVNGKKAAGGGNFNELVETDLADQLQAGDNVLAVEVKNLGETPNPAGLIGVLRIEFEQGAPLLFMTNASWKAADKESPKWQDVTFNDSSWTSAQQLGQHGIKPWGDISRNDRTRLAARMLRKEFEVTRSIKRATVYMSGLGLSELYLNGEKVGDHVLSPGLTEYTKHTFYVTHDVTKQLQQGRNAVGVILGNGRYFAPRSKVPIETRTFGYPKLLLQMHLEYTDGSSSEVISDENWKLTASGPIRANSEYDGEEYDARMEMKGWDRVGFDDKAWGAAQFVKGPEGAMAAQMIEPIRVTQTLKPVAISEPRPGVFIVDMGQNMVGWCRLKMGGPKGTSVTLRHAEVLKDGMLYLDNIRSAKVTDVYTLKGEGEEVYEPRFTYHGFRYVEIRGFPGRPSLGSIEGRVVHDDMPRSGEFVSSNPLLNQIYKNIVWGVRGNYRSFPTDCPQRDERQAWLGDRSAESKGETYLYDVSALYSKWIDDIRDSQKDTGSLPDVAPHYWPIYSDNITWPGSYVIIPNALREQYGETRLIERHYPTMKKWVQYMGTFMKDGLMPRDTYGDWCVPPESQELIHSQDPMRKTKGEIIATCYYYHILRLMEQYANMLGKPDDARQFTDLAGKMKVAFNKKYFDAEKGQYDNGSQTSSVLPLAFGLVPEEHRQKVFQKLVQKITVESKNHIGTGLIGGQWLMRVLSDNGRADLAYTIASQKDYPSWGYMISKGATTIWELWNGDTADPAMNSGNHVMLVGDLNIWLHEYLAGIRPDPDQPGFQHFVLRPYPVGDLRFVRASHKSMHGLIESKWRHEGNWLMLDVTVPTNTSATLYLPARSEQGIKEGGQSAQKAKGVRFVGLEKDVAVYELTSGKYSFLSRMP
jgi:alpha-L-rhamnosidase